jgi:isopenicillin N synthase-like dioxygenase
MQHIPKADLNDFRSGDPQTKERFVQHIGSSFKEIGFLALRGHFLNAELQEELKANTKLKAVEDKEGIPVSVRNMQKEELLAI